MERIAKFSVGERVIHSSLGYRAVIIDADPFFQPSGPHNPRACKREFAMKNAWYRLLVDGSSQMTYVEECFLKKDPSDLAIDNPNLGRYLSEQRGIYLPRSNLH